VEYQRAPERIITAVERGLLLSESWLRAPVVVKVPLRRRDPRLHWPAAFLSAVIGRRELNDGLLAVWAMSWAGSLIVSVGGAAREFTSWPPPEVITYSTGLTLEDLISFPEFVAAQQATMMALGQGRLL
jgi:hypothetical protein